MSDWTANNIQEDSDLRDILTACVKGGVDEGITSSLILARYPKLNDAKSLIKAFKYAIEYDQSEQFDFDCFRHVIPAVSEGQSRHLVFETQEDEGIATAVSPKPNQGLEHTELDRPEEKDDNVDVANQHNHKELNYHDKGVGNDDESDTSLLSSPCINESSMPDPPLLALEQQANDIASRTKTAAAPPRSRRPMLTEPPNVLHRVESAKAKSLLGLTNSGHVLNYWYRSGQIYATLDQEYTKRLTYSITAADFKRAEKYQAYLATKAKDFANSAQPVAKLRKTAAKKYISEAKVLSDTSKYETSIITARQARDGCAADLQNANVHLRKASAQFETCAEAYHNAEKDLLNAEETHLDIQDKLGTLNNALIEAKRALISFKRQQV